MAGYRRPVAVDEYGRPIPIDGGTSNRQTTSAPGPIGWLTNEVERDLHRLIKSIEDAADWELVDLYAGQILGQEAFGLGVGYGIAENLVGSVGDLLALIKTFVLANLYDVAHHPMGWHGASAITYVEALAADRFFHLLLEEDHRQRDKILAELKYAFLHPGEFFGAIGKQYVDKYHLYLAASERGTASGDFVAGKLVGGLVLDILAVIGMGEAAVKFAGKIPELVRLARTLRTPLKLARPLAGGAGAAEGVAEAEKTAAGAARAVGRTLKYQPSSGAVLQATPGRTTTILGSYSRDTQEILSELGNVKSTDLGPRVGDFNVLNVPDGYDPASFWEDWNKPWLQQAIDRNDVIIIATDPTPDVLLRRTFTNEKILTGFGREMDFLKSQGYVLDSATNQMIPGK